MLINVIISEHLEVCVTRCRYVILRNIGKKRKQVQNKYENIHLIESNCHYHRRRFRFHADEIRKIPKIR